MTTLWKDEYSVLDPIIDAQHQKLFSLFEQLSQMLYAPTTKKDLESVLNELKRYTVDHFQEEEVKMQAAHYPGYAPHKEKHQAFVRKLEEIMQTLDSDLFSLTEDLYMLLSQWVVTHIQTEDKLYVGKI